MFNKTLKIKKVSTKKKSSKHKSNFKKNILFKKFFSKKKTDEYSFPDALQPISYPIIKNSNYLYPSLFKNLPDLITKLGVFFRLDIFGFPFYVVSDSKIANTVFDLPNKNFPKKVFNVTTPSLAKKSVFSVDNEDWKAQRPIVSRAFNDELISKYLFNFIPQIISFSGKIEGDNVNLFPMLEFLAGDFTVSVGTGHYKESLNNGEVKNLSRCPFHKHVLTTIEDTIDVQSSLKSLYPSVMENLNKDIEKTNYLVNTKIKESYQKPENIMKNINFPSKTKDIIKIDNYLAIITAATRNMNSPIIWCLYYLSENKSYRDRLYEEISTHFPDGIVNVSNTILEEKLSEMTYFDSFIYEVLRLHTFVNSATRATDELPIDVEGMDGKKYTIRPNSNIYVALDRTMKTSSNWRIDPNIFEPERNIKDDLFNQSWLPFGGGKRMCVGRDLGIKYIKITLIQILYLYDVSYVKGEISFITVNDYPSPEPKSGTMLFNFHKKKFKIKHLSSNKVTNIDINKEQWEEKPSNINSIKVFYASSAGTTKQFMMNIYSDLKNYSLPIEITDISKNILNPFENEDCLYVFGVPTYNGHPPFEAETFFNYLNGLNEQINIHFLVIGFGNSSWGSTFLRFSKTLFSVLESKGGKPITNSIIPIDKQKKSQIPTKIKDIITNILKYFSINEKTSIKSQPMFNISFLNKKDVLNSDLTLLDIHDLSNNLGFSEGKVISKMNLVNDHDTKIYKLTISNFKGKYIPGDHLRVCCKNNPEQITKFQKFMKIKKNIYINIFSKEKIINPFFLFLASVSRDFSNSTCISLSLIIEYYIDLNSLIFPEFLEYVESKIKIDSPKEITILDFCLQNNISLSLEQVIKHWPRLTPRAYSISSGINKELSICVGLLKNGLCSNYLSRLHHGDSLYLKVISDPHMHINNLHTKVIFVAAGTGVTPFLGMLEDELIKKKNNNNELSFYHNNNSKEGKILNEIIKRSPISKQKYQKRFLLFYGTRNKNTIVEKEKLLEYEKENICDVKLAFSREEKKRKTYVQDLIKKNKMRVKMLIENEQAKVLMCGSKNLIDDTKQILRDILDNNKWENFENKQLVVEYWG